MIGRWPCIFQALLRFGLIEPGDLVRHETKQGDREHDQRDCCGEHCKIHLNVLIYVDNKKPPPGNAEQGRSVGLEPVKPFGELHYLDNARLLWFARL